MRKLDPEQFQDTEFIQLSHMPYTEMIAFKEWLTETDIFSIDDRDQTFHNCVNYDDYEFWFDHVKSENQVVETELF